MGRGVFSSESLRRAYGPPLGLAVIVLWLVAVGFVAWAAALGLAPVALLAPVFVLLAYGTWRRWRWALWVDLVGTGSQVFAAIGAAVEVARGGADKAAIGAPTGIAPLLAAELNLGFSLAAALLFGWALLRLRRA